MSDAPRLQHYLRRLTLALLLSLAAIVCAWQLAGKNPGWGLILLLPLAAPVAGVLRGKRRTYAWATLCVIPCFVLGMTEAIANPDQRSWAGACLVFALALFVVLIGYLRVTRGQVTR